MDDTAGLMPMTESNEKDFAPKTSASKDAVADSGDKLVLHDVLAEKYDPCNVSSNLQFRYDAEAGAIRMEITNSIGTQKQSIAMPAADLTAGGSLSDSQVLQMLLAQSKPPVDS